MSRPTDSDPSHPALIDLNSRFDKQIEEKLCQLAPKSFRRTTVLIDVLSLKYHTIRGDSAMVRRRVGDAGIEGSRPI